jgi:hypothetical protein
MVEQPMRQQQVAGTPDNTAADVPSRLEPVPAQHVHGAVDCDLVANFGSRMYNAASGWLMTTE